MHVAYANITSIIHRGTASSVKKPRVDSSSIIDYTSDGVLIDSGASDHMIGSVDTLEDVEPHSATVILPNSSVIECTQKGTMRVRFYSTSHNRYFTVALLNTLVVPSLRLPLVSTNRLSESGHIVQFDAVGIQLTLCASSPAPVIIRLPHSFSF
jgi:hypothetical protein